MSQQNRCPNCGAEISADGLQGLCPKCLMGAGLERGNDSEQQSGSGTEAVTTPHGLGFLPPKPAALAGYFPQLEILELVGQGGMGAVYKARQPKLDRIVALKIIRPESADTQAFADRFNREARLLARLNHPHIVSIYDFGEVSITDAASGGPPRPLYFFLMEYVEGANLRELMRAGQLMPKQVLTIIPQVCEALQFAHDDGIVHRDIKPENILLDKRGRVKIADFGLAKLVGQAPETFVLTATHQLMGTPRYMAPEQMDGARAVDHRADIYSLGVVFYEMLTGDVPAGHFEPPSKKVDVDVRLDEVVLRAMAREPERRYQHASELKTDVERCSSRDMEAEKRNILALNHGQRSPKSNFVVAALVLSVFFIAAVSVGYIAYWRQYSSDDPNRANPTADAEGGQNKMTEAMAHYEGQYRSRAGVMLTVGASDGQLVTKLSPSSELETAESIPSEPKTAAIQILDALKRNDATPIGALMAARIPADWPKRIEQHVWPDNLKKFGELQSFKLLGWEQRTDGRPDSEMVDVWAVLLHARGEALAFLLFSADDHKLQYLVLDADKFVCESELGRRPFALLSGRTFHAGNEGAMLRFDEGLIVLNCRPIQSTFLRIGKVAADGRDPIPPQSNAAGTSRGPDLAIKVVDAKGTPISGVNCRVVVGGYPSSEKGYPRQPEPKNMLSAVTNTEGLVEFRHEGLKKDSRRHIIYVDKESYSSETEFLDVIDKHNRDLHIVLFHPQFVTLRFVFQGRQSLSFVGDGIVKGQVVLYPMQGGSYRPPARAHFNLAENRRVGSSGVLDAATPGIGLDQKQGKLYFGGSNGRFDHFTDLGRVDFEAVKACDPDLLQRKREDTEIHEGHTYLYESNIYEPKQRTKFTGLDVRYAKVFVESTQTADVPARLLVEPDPIRAGNRVTISYHPGSVDLHGAVEMRACWATYDADGKSLISIAATPNHAEFPSEARGTEGGEFKLGRKRCRTEVMAPLQNGIWKCELDIPTEAKTLALLFVDDIERTSAHGIQTFPVHSE